MVIKSIEMVNFMGFAGTATVDLPKISALIGPNGMGKTSVMNAIRFGLTGQEPEGEIIHLGADKCTVSVTLTDAAGTDYVFSREKFRDKPSKCRIDGKVTTQKAMNDKIEGVVGIAIDKIKVLSSADIVAAMKPQEFQSFILDYIPEKLPVEKVISFVPDVTEGMVEIINGNLPSEGITMEDLEEFDKVCRATRKLLKEEIASKKAVYATKPQEDPGLSKADLEKQLEEVSGLKAAYDVYLEKKKAYQRSVEEKARHGRMLADVKAEAARITATRPNAAEKEALEKELSSTEESIRNNKVGIASTKGSIAQLETALRNLENPVCPLSEKIVCKMDKTAAKEGLIESIAAGKEGVKALEAELAKAEARHSSAKAMLNAWRGNAMAYDQLVTLKKQIKQLSDNAPKVLPEPEEVTAPDIKGKREEITRKLRSIDEYAAGKRLANELEFLSENLGDYEKLVAALAEKGPIRTGIIESYLKVFEEAANARSTKVRPGITFKFVSKDGVIVLMDNGKGAFLPYSALSGGEKAYMLFILMDMLNSLCGTKILLLDELSVMDAECFGMLLDLVKEYGTDYDHVVLAAVDHEDTVESIRAKGIPLLSLPGIGAAAMGASAAGAGEGEA